MGDAGASENEATTLAQFREEVARDGRFQRQQSHFRGCVTIDGSQGYVAAPHRYHLYVSYACPWAHRSIIVRMLKGLEDVIGMTVVDPIRDERGWRFTEGNRHGLDAVNNFSFLSEAYLATDPSFHGRVTTPTLWDTHTETVVCNESSEIIRMLNGEFNAWAQNPGLDLYPVALRDEIDAVNERVYNTVNNGVYRAGFATRQEAYEEAVMELFETLDWLEARLSQQRYLVSGQLTEADWRLFVTLIRFDSAYHGHFKCNIRRIVDYPALFAYTRELYQHEGIAETTVFDHIKRHYYMTHPAINPTRIVPVGPDIDFTVPHNRDQVPAIA